MVMVGIFVGIVAFIVGYAALFLFGDILVAN
jgi:hypothetical protein